MAEPAAVASTTMQYTGHVNLKYQQGKGSFGSSLPRFRAGHMSQAPGQFKSDGSPSKIGPGHYQQQLTQPPKLSKDGKTIRKNKGLFKSNFALTQHYKLGLKQESYSKKGYGVGFVSKRDRFTGVVEEKFIMSQNLRQAQSMPTIAPPDG